MRVPVPSEVLPATSLGRVHLVGVGGAGLSAIARLLHQQGVDVTGSDQRETDVVEALRAEGIVCHVGHRAENVMDRDTVIVSTAVQETNPEVMAARSLGLRLWPRSSGLMSTMLGDRRLAIAGTHGKTTTAAMATLALREAGLDVSFAIGAQVPALGTNARRGSSDLFVVEADESDGAFLHYAPHAAIITNIDADHLDTWGTVEAYDQAFVEFIDTVSGPVVLCADDPGCAKLAEQRPERTTTTGFTQTADVRGTDLSIRGHRTTFTAVFPDGQRHEVRLEVPGQHYAQDALLALALGWLLGADRAAFARGLTRHTGASRRMELKGQSAGVQVYDSYAHHPTEIAADVAAARSIAGDDRLVVAFQPHLVSRTRLFGAQMGRALSAADLVVVSDIYLAREEPDPDVTAALVLDAVQGVPAIAGGAVTHLDGVLRDLVEPGDLVLTLGAGDVTEVGPRLLAGLAGGDGSDGS